MTEEWAARARSFGEVAERYDRWRPGYPDRLYADVLALGAGHRVLEAGAGTGRATVELARRGATVLAVEPDPAMAAVARERTRGTTVEVEESTFEHCRAPSGSFDLVVSAQAWHWVDPSGGAARAADALDRPGALAVWWNRARELDGPVWDAVQDAYARHAPELDRRDQVRAHSHHTHPDPGLEPTPGFTPWTSLRYDWVAVYDADAYVGLLGTHSDHLRLQAPQRDRLLDAVREAIVDVGGGYVEYRYRTLLLHARAR